MIKMTIEGMMCQHCAGRVQKALEALGCKAEIRLEDKCALISDAAGADDAALRAAVEKQGYTVKAVEHI
jgi:copper chaperone CopZ